MKMLGMFGVVVREREEEKKGRTSSVPYSEI